MDYNNRMFSFYLQGIKLKFFLKYFLGSLNTTIFIVILCWYLNKKMSIFLAIRILNVKLNLKYLNILY